MTYGFCYSLYDLDAWNRKSVLNYSTNYILKCHQKVMAASNPDVMCMRQNLPHLICYANKESAILLLDNFYV